MFSQCLLQPWSLHPVLRASVAWSLCVVLLLVASSVWQQIFQKYAGLPAYWMCAAVPNSNISWKYLTRTHVLEGRCVGFKVVFLLRANAFISVNSQIPNFSILSRCREPDCSWFWCYHAQRYEGSHSRVAHIVQGNTPATSGERQGQTLSPVPRRDDGCAWSW